MIQEEKDRQEKQIKEALKNSNYGYDYDDYVKAMKEEMSKPEFAESIKSIILNVVNKTLEKNSGIVPPAFAKKVVDEPSEEELKAQEEEKLLQKQQQEKELQEKKLEEEQKLDNILKGI